MATTAIPTFSVADLSERLDEVEALARKIVALKAEIVEKVRDLENFDLASEESSRYMSGIHAEIGCMREEATNEQFDPAELLERTQDALGVINLNLRASDDG